MQDEKEDDPVGLGLCVGGTQWRGAVNPSKALVTSRNDRSYWFRESSKEPPPQSRSPTWTMNSGDKALTAGTVAVRISGPRVSNFGGEKSFGAAGW